MRNCLILFLLIFSTGCAEKELTKSEQITAYYEGFHNSDYTQIKKTLSDSLITIAGDFTMPFSRHSYYEKFKWDSVFKPTYKLIKIENQGEHAIATMTMTSLKHEFLNNSPMTCKLKFHFKAGKIAKIEDLDCSDANWVLWAKGVENLTVWIKQNHPELDGFINDLTIKGAQDYLQAIALYNQREIKLVEKIKE